MSLGSSSRPDASSRMPFPGSTWKLPRHVIDRLPSDENSEPRKDLPGFVVYGRRWTRLLPGSHEGDDVLHLIVLQRLDKRRHPHSKISLLHELHDLVVRHARRNLGHFDRCVGRLASLGAVAALAHPLE